MSAGVLVVGTGAMACSVGARLARAGTAVTLAGTWSAALEAIAARGVRVHEVQPARAAPPPAPGCDPPRTPDGEPWSVPVTAERIDRLTASYPVALVLVKSYQTAAVAAFLARVLTPSGLALTLQNGLGNRETLTAALGATRLAAGIAVMGATLLAPGEVRSDAGRAVLGLESATADRIGFLATLLAAAGMSVRTTTQTEAAVWRKLIANCAINPLTALHGLTNGSLLDDPRLVAQMVAAAREVAEVATAKRLHIEGDPATIALAVARATRENRSSMLQDLERGARTEIDAMNGAVVHEAQVLGVETPVNRLLFRLVREREGRPTEDAA